jgi:hypothetical protein
MPANDATACNRRCLGEREAEVLEDREGIVGEELAAQLVAREAIAVDQRDRYSSAGEKGG